MLFVHGGGWVMGGVKSHDHIARWLAAEIGARVIQIDYSLAPEHPYPAALNEIIAALSSVLAEAAGAPVFVAGDSAGANLAACAILRLSKDERSQLAGFISIYGAYAPEMNFSSHRLYGDGRFGLSEPQMRWFWNLYAPQLPPETRARALSPLTADLSDFPPTLCIGAECDLLLDDTLAFYGELTKVGVDVSLSLWSGLPHGCLHFVAAVRSVTEAAGSIVQFVRSRTIAHPSKPLRTDRPPAAPPAPEIARPELIDVEPVVASGRSRLHGTLAHRIAGDIIRDVLPPGVLLPREESAGEAFGVSRSVYREALRTLAAKGLVTSQPKVGSRVAPRSSWHVLDPSLLEWRFRDRANGAFHSRSVRASQDRGAERRRAGGDAPAGPGRLAAGGRAFAHGEHQSTRRRMAERHCRLSSRTPRLGGATRRFMRCGLPSRPRCAGRSGCKRCCRRSPSPTTPSPIMRVCLKKSHPRTRQARSPRPRCSSTPR